MRKYQYMIVYMNINKAEFLTRYISSPVLCIYYMCVLFISFDVSICGAQGSLATHMGPRLHSCPAGLIETS